MDGTLKITDPRMFFKSISCLVPSGLSIECGDAIVFRIGGESVRVSTDGDLAALVFGSVERRSPDAALLRDVFPLPLPSYGLNYI